KALSYEVARRLERRQQVQCALGRGVTLVLVEDEDSTLDRDSVSEVGQPSVVQGGRLGWPTKPQQRAELQGVPTHVEGEVAQAGVSEASIQRICLVLHPGAEVVGLLASCVDSLDEPPPCR